MSFDDLEEPIRLVGSFDPASVGLVSFLLNTLRSEDVKCSGRIVPFFSDEQFEVLGEEEYPSFVFVGDCFGDSDVDVSAEGYFGDSSVEFLGLNECYNWGCDFSGSCVDFSYIVVCGFFSRYLNGLGFEVIDSALEDSLESGKIVCDDEVFFDELTPELVGDLRLDSTPFDNVRGLAEMINGCVNSDDPSVTVTSLIGDSDSQMRARGILRDYQRQKNEVIDWYERNLDDFVVDDDYIVVDMEGHSLANTCSYLASYLMEDYDFVVVLADNHHGETLCYVRPEGFFDELLDRVDGFDLKVNDCLCMVSFETRFKKDFIGDVKNFMKKVSVEESIG